MKNSVSDKNIYIDSEEDDEEAVEEGRKSDGSDSSSDESDDAPRGSRPNSYTNQWPQSYRQSIDMYSYMGTPSLSNLTGSFLTNSFINKNPPEILSSIIKPLLPTKSTDDLFPQHSEEEIKSSHSILVGGVSRKSSLGVILEDKKFDAHGFDGSRQCSYTQAVLNGMNVLCGVGILSTPYAIKQGGWIGLSILFIFAILAWYTGILLRKCLDSKNGLQTYPDIGHEAFGTTGRILISIVLYVELYACCVEYIILESDNLSSLFPNAHLNIGGIYLDSHIFFAILTTLVVLPTTWLRDLSLLSYISAGGVIASFLVVMSLFWLGIIDHVGFESKNDSLLDISGIPIAIGLYGYCYSGHAVFPNIYSSLKKRDQFPSVLFSSFGLCTVLFAGVAIMGYLMFGETTESQFTLNLPQNLVASKIALWTTVVNPITKYPLLFNRNYSILLYTNIFIFMISEPQLIFTYALTLMPMALSFEELIPSNRRKSHFHSIIIRSALVISTLCVALSVPFFGLVMAFIGSFLTMLVTYILPCACFLSILKGKVTWFQWVMCVSIIVIGVLCACIGTFSSLSQIIISLLN